MIRFQKGTAFDSQRLLHQVHPELCAREREFGAAWGTERQDDTTNPPAPCHKRFRVKPVGSVFSSAAASAKTQNQQPLLTLEAFLTKRLPHLRLLIRCRRFQGTDEREEIRIFPQR